jgi:hypothetical protein
MPQKPISTNKVRQLLLFSTVDNFNKSRSAKRLKIARSTATKYIKAFHRSGLTLTDIERVGSTALADLLFAGHRRRSQSDRKASFLDRIESIHDRVEHDRLSILDVWREEAARQHFGYKYSRFASLYANWRVEQGLPKTLQRGQNAVSISPLIFLLSTSGGYRMIDANGRWRLPSLTARRVSVLSQLAGRLSEYPEP